MCFVTPGTFAQVYTVGESKDYNGSYIIMEYLNFGGRCDQAALGHELAKVVTSGKRRSYGKHS